MLLLLKFAGSFKGSYRAPLKGFGVDIGRSRADPYKNCIAE